MGFSVQSLALALCSFGPAIILFGEHASKKSHTICLFIGSSFTYYISLMLCSFLYFAIKLNHNLNTIEFIVNVGLQELFRYLWFSLVRRTDFYVMRYLEKKNSYRHIKYAYICGLGYGFSSNVFQVSNVVRDLIGPGTVGINSKGSEFFLIVLGLLSLFNFCNQILWSIIMYYGNMYSDRISVIYVVITHLTLCLINLTSNIKPGVILLICSIASSVGSSFYIFRILHKFPSYVDNDDSFEDENDILSFDRTINAPPDIVGTNAT